MLRWCCKVISMSPCGLRCLDVWLEKYWYLPSSYSEPLKLPFCIFQAMQAIKAGRDLASATSRSNHLAETDRTGSSSRWIANYLLSSCSIIGVGVGEQGHYSNIPATPAPPCLIVDEVMAEKALTSCNGLFTPFIVDKMCDTECNPEYYMRGSSGNSSLLFRTGLKRGYVLYYVRLISFTHIRLQQGKQLHNSYTIADIFRACSSYNLYSTGIPRRGLGLVT
ncbi:hypothetical protein F4821DRAFT_112827 [Hypoxylon rubiginosum]|uniref:Uncharacterized protein n=1 Tax=Hypoxylon rubiginosum TaxID=110542 RepID=A0ACC0DJG6_9PEZI|nr:hypothetical protein F4821DRAFT_112827 [Hypoxylon rubiginosum]